MDIEQIKSKQQEIFAEFKAAIPPNDLKAQKRLAIAEQTISFANQLATDFKNIAQYQRKIARIFRKRKYSKAEAKRLRLVSMLNAEMNRIQLQKMIQTPIPKTPFPKGGNYQSGMAVVDEQGNELILGPDGKLEIAAWDKYFIPKFPKEGYDCEINNEQ